MKILTLFSFLAVVHLLNSAVATGQGSYAPGTPLSFASHDYDGGELSSRKWSLPGLTSDRPRTYRPSRPYLSQPVNTSSLLGNSYWMGSVTSQSFNQGKFGRYYYWDVQGNLRGSHLFLDIAGKNKRGLKLVFPRHRVLF